MTPMFQINCFLKQIQNEKFLAYGKSMITSKNWPQVNLLSELESGVLFLKFLNVKLYFWFFSSSPTFDNITAKLKQLKFASFFDHINFEVNELPLIPL